MTPRRRRPHDRSTNRLSTTDDIVPRLLTATVLVASLSMTATALGDPELVALLAALGCGLALLGLALTAMRRRQRAVPV